MCHKSLHTIQVFIKDNLNEFASTLINRVVFVEMYGVQHLGHFVYNNLFVENAVLMAKRRKASH